MTKKAFNTYNNITKNQQKLIVFALKTNFCPLFDTISFSLFFRYVKKLTNLNIFKSKCVGVHLDYLYSSSFIITNFIGGNLDLVYIYIYINVYTVELQNKSPTE